MNVTGTLCDEHLAGLREHLRRQEADRLATARAQWRYYIPDGSLDVDGHDDFGAWVGYEVYDAKGNTPKEFVEALSISECDQDGGEADCYSFWDAGSAVQQAILDAVGIQWSEIEE